MNLTIRHLMRSVLWACLAAAALATSAQQIQISAQPYIDRPALWFAPPQAPEPAQAGAAIAAPGQQTREWTVNPADGSLARSLGRWARQANMPVIWEADRELPALLASYRGTFMAALEQLMIDSGNSAYPVHACIYDNLVRVIQDAQACKR